ncbi:hypothetical protein BDV28DRAFT_145252 [Aspergillus coremiiformis]|uniref:Uncharacterized protein n=1 Tax=Aspergillus coremiiformis TaxID=138285 RepID=A0A5N6ZHH8_9EURO|nr:hypothetical protein BDV28DRAFT_145252 [Aspergillus coremiiformis]
MNNNSIIAIIVVTILLTTGLVCGYAICWRKRARTELRNIRAEARKRRTSLPQTQVSIMRGPSRAPSVRSAPPPPPPPPPPPRASTTPRQGGRARSRSYELEGSQPVPRQVSGQVSMRTARGRSKRQQKKERRRQQQQRRSRQQQQNWQHKEPRRSEVAGNDGWAAGSMGQNIHPVGSGDDRVVQKRSPSMFTNIDWGVGLPQSEVQGAGRQNAQVQSGPVDDEWRTSNEAVAGSPGRAGFLFDEWGNPVRQREVSQGRWHADDAMDHRSEWQQSNVGVQQETEW